MGPDKYGWIHESNARVVYNPPIAPCIISFRGTEVFGRAVAHAIVSITPFTTNYGPMP
jgi:hypothetical protein